MDRRSFLASLAAAVGSRFLCPTGEHAVAAPVVAAPPVSGPLTMQDILKEMVRLMAERMTALRVDRLAVHDCRQGGWRLGDTVFIPDPTPERFVPFSHGPFIRERLPSTLMKQKTVDLYLPPKTWPSKLAMAQFSQRYLEPMAHVLANALGEPVADMRHGRNLLVTGDLPVPGGLDAAGRVAHDGISLRGLCAYELCQGRFDQDGYVLRFDVLHGVVSL